MPPQTQQPGRAIQCRESRLPASPSAARGARRPPSSRPPAKASARGVSFNDLGGAGEDRWRDGEAEFLRGLQIDDQLEFRRLLNWQIRRLLPLEDPSGVNADLAIGICQARPIAD